jgi:hypothetical protein
MSSHTFPSALSCSLDFRNTPGATGLSCSFCATLPLFLLSSCTYGSVRRLALRGGAGDASARVDCTTCPGPRWRKTAGKGFNQKCAEWRCFFRPRCILCGRGVMSRKRVMDMDINMNISRVNTAVEWERVKLAHLSSVHEARQHSHQRDDVRLIAALAWPRFPSFAFALAVHAQLYTARRRCSCTRGSRACR